nr:epidermis-specific secreted glycoprotein ep1 [Quercus suber]
MQKKEKKAPTLVEQSLNEEEAEVTALPAYGYLPVSSPISWTNREPTGDVENSPTLWTDRESTADFYKPNAGIILASRSFSDPVYESVCGCGFFCNQTCNSSLFAIFTFHSDFDSTSVALDGAEVPWSANPNNPVRNNATLKLTSKRGLVLQDADGTIAWSTNIGNKSVAGLLLTNTCNLMLLDEKNSTNWQSLDHPTDTLVLGQKWVAGQQLTGKGGVFSLSLTSQGLFSYINSNPPQGYFFYNPGIDNISYVQFLNRSLAFFNQSFKLFSELEMVSTSSALQYMRFEPDGHLRVYHEDQTQWRNFDRSQPEEAMHLVDLFKKKFEEDRLLDLVDKYSEDMQLHGEEVVNTMRVAAWCLQNDFTKRPSMSMVVKVFEGVMNVESDLDYFFSNGPLLNTRAGVDNQEVHIIAATPLLPSILSGPR